MDTVKTKSHQSNPRKRPPIHKKSSFNEICDNIKNDQINSELNFQLYETDDDEDDVTHSYSNNNRNTSSDLKDKNVRINSKQKSAPITKSNKTNRKLNFKFLMYVSIFGLVLISVIYFLEKPSKSFKIKHNHIEFVEEKVKMNLKNIQSKFKNQEKNLWADVFNGISNIIKNPTKPCIILLLGNKSDPLDCLAGLLGNVSSYALSSEISLQTPENFEFDVGSVIESMRSTTKNHKAVIIWDLLNINVEALKAFHNLCDRINPLAGEVIYIITIIADGYDKESNAYAFVEKELFKKLSGKIKEDTIQPLITRITDGPIFIVKPEPSITDCPLRKLLNRVKT